MAGSSPAMTNKGLLATRAPQWLLADELMRPS
jgi:hypothetical protein